MAKYTVATREKFEHTKVIFSIIRRFVHYFVRNKKVLDQLWIRYCTKNNAEAVVILTVRWL
jgi:hypothetical protein